MVKQLRSLLVLGRISNLPTVWSNCLAAWILAGGGPWPRFALACTGGTLLYTGGMFLNDAFDVDFDRRYRPERPIVAGQLRASFVWSSGAALLLVGCGCFCLLGASAALFALALAGTITLYDAVHKKTSLAPLLMAACRFLLCLAAASAATPGGARYAWFRAAMLAAYIVGLSYIARRESDTSSPVLWPIPLLFLPVLIGVGVGSMHDWFAWARALGAGLWIFWCIYSAKRAVPTNLPRGVAGLLAGIALLDWLAASPQAPVAGLVCVGLFLLALLLQKVAPAT